MVRARQNQSKTMKIKCLGCQTTSNHEILFTYSQRVDNEDESIWWDIKCNLVRCKGCDNVAFHRRMFSPDSDPETTDEVFPDPDIGREPVDNYYLLPTQLRNVYLEVLKALDSNQPILSGIGIRAIVETVCKERKTKGRNLERKIDDLIKQEVLTQDGAKLLHKLRTIGNKAAHEVEPHSAEELSLAMDVINHLILGVYILPKRETNIFVNKS